MLLSLWAIPLISNHMSRVISSSRIYSVMFVLPYRKEGVELALAVCLDMVPNLVMANDQTVNAHSNGWSCDLNTRELQ